MGRKSRRTPEEIARDRAERITGLRKIAANILGYDPLTFERIPRWQRDAMVQGRIINANATKAGARLARSMPDAEGPVPQAMQHAAYVKSAMGIDKATVAYNLTVTPLRAAERDGHISKRLLDAGETFERIHIIAYHCGGTRDPLDMTPRGHDHISESAAAAIVRARSEMAEIERRTGHQTYAKMVDVCVNHLPIGRKHGKNGPMLGWARLMAGLTEVADYLRLPRGD